MMMRAHELISRSLRQLAHASRRACTAAFSFLGEALDNWQLGNAIAKRVPVVETLRIRVLLKEGRYW